MSAAGEPGNGAGENTLAVPGPGTGWEGADPEWSDGEVRLEVGRLERWLLPLDFDSPMALFEAGDAIAGDLAHVIEPIMGDGDRVLSDDCYRLTGNDWVDRLLVLRSIELLPQLRGHGVGAWASARSIGVLVRDSGTLIATQSAPLHRSPFLRDADADHGRDFTPAEDRAWQRAQKKIAAHWQHSLGLVPLPEYPHILIGTGDTVDKRCRATAGTWAEWPGE
jgi:hypothetical protein